MNQHEEISAASDPEFRYYRNLSAEVSAACNRFFRSRGIKEALEYNGFKGGARDISEPKKGGKKCN